jgi:hypothetical protein
MTEDTPGARSVCHGCRQLTQVRGDDGDIHPMILPGSGSLWGDRAPGGMVEVPCPVCADSEEAGWLPGFLPPV